jgi:2'-5' RNA ligase
MSQSLYFIALIPPAPVAEEVTGFKKEIALKYNSSRALRSPAHITLQAPFWYEVSWEERLTGTLNDFCRALKAFPLELYGFSKFDKRVIYVNVMQNEKLGLLHKDLMYFLREKLSFPASATSLSFHPHMTIGFRDLSPEMCVKAWEEFSKRSYKANFEVRSLFLLKHNRKEWDVLREVPFGEGV